MSKKTDLNNNNQDQDDIKVFIWNITSTFSTSCHLNLRKIAQNGYNVEYKREAVYMKIRNPSISATIYSTGHVFCAGAKSEEESLIGARRIARQLQKLGFNIKMKNYRIVGAMSTSNVPFRINLTKLASLCPNDCNFEPELSPSAHIRFKDLNSTISVHSTGNFSLMTKSVHQIKESITRIYPIFYESQLKPLSNITNLKRI